LGASSVPDQNLIRYAIFIADMYLGLLSDVFLDSSSVEAEDVVHLEWYLIE
jgi:hypothetical protein